VPSALLVFQPDGQNQNTPLADNVDQGASGE